MLNMQEHQELFGCPPPAKIDTNTEHRVVQMVSAFQKDGGLKLYPVGQMDYQRGGKGIYHHRGIDKLTGMMC